MIPVPGMIPFLVLVPRPTIPIPTPEFYDYLVLSAVLYRVWYELFIPTLKDTILLAESNIEFIKGIFDKTRQLADIT